MQVRANRAYSIKVALVLGVFFCGTLAFMWSSAMVTSQRVRETQKYKDKLADLKSENAILAIDVAEQMDLDTVKQIATEKFRYGRATTLSNTIHRCSQNRVIPFTIKMTQKKPEDKKHRKCFSKNNSGFYLKRNDV